MVSEESYVNSGAIKRPTGITVLAILLIFGAFVNLFMIFGGAPVRLYGSEIYGISAQVY